MLMDEDASELLLELRSSALETKGKKSRFFKVRSLKICLTVYSYSQLFFNLILPAIKIIAVEIPDDILERRRDPTREKDQRRIKMKRPSPTPKTRGLS